MCAISEKVKRFLENNFEKIYPPLAKDSQPLENSVFFVCEKILTFFDFFILRPTSRFGFWGFSDSVRQKKTAFLRSEYI